LIPLARYLFINRSHFFVSDFGIDLMALPFFHWQMAILAKACVNRDPKQRPKMRDVVVSLMKLNSTIDDESRTGSAELSLAVEHDSN
jgi:hypothetical protein